MKEYVYYFGEEQLSYVRARDVGNMNMRYIVRGYKSHSIVMPRRGLQVSVVIPTMLGTEKISDKPEYPVLNINDLLSWGEWSFLENSKIPDNAVQLEVEKGGIDEIMKLYQKFIEKQKQTGTYIRNNLCRLTRNEIKVMKSSNGCKLAELCEEVLFKNNPVLQRNLY